MSIAIVGKDHKFAIYENSAVDTYLQGIEGEERRGQNRGGDGGEAEGEVPAAAAPMDTE